MPSTKKLYLLRHAKSDWSQPGQRDFDRELNERGYRDAPLMGQVLHRKKVVPQVIYASPARRTTLTAELVAPALPYPAEAVHYVKLLYECSLQTMLTFISRLDDQYDEVMIIGHNPTMTYTAEHLSGESLGNVPTCGVVSLAFEVDTWEAVAGRSATLEWFEYPKKYL
ncbi:phosphohistidine phosphatase [Catalinimonas alkaloidigena]|uniref:Phosphohistidine phosphatase n=1 Tax=Catalinimonas alkaloidigena TaxID=1075417 RepID=A0A1G8XVX0_9BACT|nr:histidine phosphatase family protein [Catalinimonas alkaloidigena]SDJ94663.1 phosphohistidine phosphatase [Catalinimonas alkaloidigena]